jgi:hypothetical protein
MHGLAVMSQRFLGEPLGIPHGPRALRPSIAVTMKGHSRDTIVTVRSFAQRPG